MIESVENCYCSIFIYSARRTRSRKQSEAPAIEGSAFRFIGTIQTCDKESGTYLHHVQRIKQQLGPGELEEKIGMGISKGNADVSRYAVGNQSSESLQVLWEGALYVYVGSVCLLYAFVVG